MLAAEQIGEVRIQSSSGRNKRSQSDRFPCFNALPLSCGDPSTMGSLFLGESQI
jgi:hypothetical protein